MKIFIGCGSNPKISYELKLVAKEVCKVIAGLGYDLVYGAYNEGMMGVCFNTFKEMNREVYGINITKYDDGGDYEVYDTSFERLKRICEISDKLLILPGGIGTYSELFGLLEEKAKPVIIYNYKGFYDDLIKFLNKNLDNNILYDDDLNNLIIVNNIDELERVIKDEK
ncbi:MAG: LOG family protein [Bacilli bacterium]|nr:LOG family protein [Bacilli bacterium]